MLRYFALFLHDSDISVLIKSYIASLQQRNVSLIKGVTYVHRAILSVAIQSLFVEAVKWTIIGRMCAGSSTRGNTDLRTLYVCNWYTCVYTCLHSMKAARLITIDWPMPDCILTCSACYTNTCSIFVTRHVQHFCQLTRAACLSIDMCSMFVTWHVQHVCHLTCAACLSSSCAACLSLDMCSMFITWYVQHVCHLACAACLSLGMCSMFVTWHV